MTRIAAVGDIHLGADTVDDFARSIAFHGHAHAGVEHGTTAGGVPVRNVAMPVIRSAYQVYEVAGQPVAASSSASVDGG